MTGETLRIAGVVEPSPRGRLLRVANDPCWRLIAEATIDHLPGRRITIEGLRKGGTISTDYLAPSSKACLC